KGAGADRQGSRRVFLEQAQVRTLGQIAEELVELLRLRREVGVRGPGLSVIHRVHFDVIEHGAVVVGDPGGREGSQELTVLKGLKGEPGTAARVARTAAGA